LTRPGTNEEEIAIVLLQDIKGAESFFEGFIVPAKALRPVSPGEANAIAPFNALAGDRIRRAIGKGVLDSELHSTFDVNLKQTASNARARLQALAAAVERLPADLLQRAMELHGQGKFVEAVPIARRACALSQAEAGPNHPFTALSLECLGVLLKEMSDLPGARHCLERVLAIREKVLGPEHPHTAGTLTGLGALLRSLGDLAGARHYLERALAIYEKVLGPSHPDTTTCLSRLGSLLEAMGDVAGAQPYYRRALGIAEEDLGPRHRRTADDVEDWAGAALEEVWEAVSPTVRRELEGLMQRVEELRGQGRSQEAVLIARGFLSQAESGLNHLDTATSSHILGYLLLSLDDRAGARSCWERALAIYEKVLEPEHLHTATCLESLGGLLWSMGDWAPARPYLEQALAINEKVLGPSHLHTAHSLGNLGVLLRSLGDWAGARPYLERARAICAKVRGPFHRDTAKSFNDLGGLLEAMGDWAEARSHYETALAIREKVLGPDHPDTAESLNNLGSLLKAMDDWAGARPYYERALAIREKALGPEHPRTATCLDNLGSLLTAMGELAEARHYHERALAIYEKVLGHEHPDTVTCLNNLGGVLETMGELAEARHYHERALASYEKVLGPVHPFTAACLWNLGGLYAGLDREGAALALMERAARIDDQLIGQVFSFGSDRQRLVFLRSVETERGKFLSLVLRHFQQSPEAVRAALDLILRRKAVAAEALATQREAVLTGKYPALQGALGQLVDLKRQIARQTLAGPRPEGIETHRGRLDDWSRQLERLEAELARQIPEMNLEQRLRQADRRAVALALDEGVALVEFVRFDVLDFKAVRARGEGLWQPARYLAFVLAGREPDNVQMIDLGEATPIDRLIADFRASITGDPDTWQRAMMVLHEPALSPEQGGQAEAPTDGTDATAGLELRQAVFDPLRQALGGRTRLLLAPDGDLARLPFEVLPTDLPGVRLIDNYKISYLAAGRDVLRWGAPSSGRPTQDLVAADPDFDLTPKPVAGEAHLGTAAREAGEPVARSAGGESRHSRDLDRSLRLPRLAGTRREGEQIAALLGVQPWLDQAVLDGRLKQVRSPRILHLATHGFFLGDQSRDSNQERLTPAMLGGGLDRLSGTELENPLLRSGLLLAGFNVWQAGGELPAEAEDGILTAEDVTGLDLQGTELVVLSACETGLGQVQVGEGVFGLRRAFVLAGARTLVMSLWKVPDRQTQELMVDFYGRILAGEPRAEALRQAQLALRSRYPHPRYWGAFICQGEIAPIPRWPISSQRGASQSGVVNPPLPAGEEEEYFILQINQLPHGGRDIPSVPVVGLRHVTRPDTNEAEVAVVLLQDINGAGLLVDGFIVPTKALRPISAGEANAAVPFDALAADKIRRAIARGVEDSKVLSHFTIVVGESPCDANARRLKASHAVERLLRTPNIRLHPEHLGSIVKEDDAPG
jgi:tetratricopeptide (TPR) repeat protein/CHAT domain-containing protein